MPQTISPGTRLGPYEIHSLLGAGGMGEVYRARDSRLQRDVAVKVLPKALAQDRDRLDRFEREARAAGQLNHPNIMAVHDVGSTEPNGGGLPYIVCELLEGTTLRTKLADGPIQPRKAIHLATQIARGLAAAHAKGIAHRDLKPENLMILSGDHVKILDFGLAKLLRPDHDGAAPKDDTGTVARSLTMTGEILGTPSYMSPEQVRDQPSDHRTDIFALGAILYEMLAGKRAFDGPSHADRMTAILTAEPAPLPAETEDQAPGITTIIAHCLEKSPSDRFDSANDLAFALSLTIARPRGSKPHAAGAAQEHQDFLPRDIPYTRITLREGAVHGARYTPDGRAVCYAASWEGSPVEIFWNQPGNPETRSIGPPRTDLLSIAPNGELAVALRRQSRGGFFFTGMLARMPGGGGAPRELLDGVWQADFHPDGRRIAVSREVDGMSRIEFPAGNVLYETSGWISQMRFSRDGTRIAFLDHPARGNDAGCPAVVDLNGTARKLSPVQGTTRGIAWSPDGREVVFAASDTGSRNLQAVSENGALRVVLGIPSNVTIQDISPQGGTLLVIENERMRARFLGATAEDTRDLTWLDWSLVRDITHDGSRLLFDETGHGGGPLGSVFLRGTDGSPAIRLGDGTAFELSPDGAWALTSVGHERGSLEMVPCGAGESRTLQSGGLEVDHASWFPDGRSACLLASEGGRPRRLYKLDLAGGRPVPFSEEGISYYDCHVSPDGKFAVGHNPQRKLTVYPVDGGTARTLGGAVEYERVISWSKTGDAIYVFSRGQLPVKIWRIDLKTGERAIHREISPPDTTGVEGIAAARMTPDGTKLVYSYYQRQSRMYTVEGLFS